VKILQVLPSLLRGGAEQVVILHSEALIRNNFQVTLLTKAPENKTLSFDTPDGVTKLEVSDRLNKRDVYSFLALFIWSLKNRQKFLNYDVVHGHLTYGAFFMICIRFIFLFRNSHRPKLVFTYHLSGMNVSFVSRLIQLSMKFFVDNLVFVAREEHFLFKAFYPLNNSCTIIPNGIHFPSGPKVDFKGTDENLFKASPTTTIGALSRLSADRKPHLYLDLFNSLDKLEFPRELQFVLAGYGPLIEQLKKQVSSCFDHKRVLFPGYIADREEFFTSLDIYVTLVVDNYPGISGLEAISFGTPTFGILLSPENHKSNFLPIPCSSNLELLANDIQSYCNNHSKISSLISKQFSWAKNNFSIEKMFNSYLDVYGKI